MLLFFVWFCVCVAGGGDGGGGEGGCFVCLFVVFKPFMYLDLVSERSSHSCFRPFVVKQRSRNYTPLSKNPVA